MSTYQMEQHPQDLTQELDEARKIQMGMLPQSVPEISGFQIAAYSMPAMAVGGDFYDFIPLGDDRLGVVIGDAVGHGIAAALLMTMTLTDFRSLAPRYVFPAEVLNNVNSRLIRSMRTKGFVTSIYAVLDLTIKRLVCAMAGMQPWLIKVKFQECVPIEPYGEHFPLGTFQKSQYQSCDVQMGEGDSLVLFTDGIPEAEDEDGELYSFERLEKTLVKNSSADAQKLLDAVMTDMRQFTGGRPQEDDITLVVLKATESIAVAPVVPTARFITGEQKSVTMLFAVGDSELPTDVVKQVNTLLREHGGMMDVMNDDTIVALFGVPRLHEDDAERAITAAQAIQGLDMPITFGIGIDTGTAIIRSNADIDYHEMGETMRFALHLANSAKLGQVLVSERAHQLTSGAFQFSAVTQVQPYDDEAISAYPVIASAEQPHHARGIQGLYSPMIGREQEMERLTACIDDLLNGRGQIVSITGEAGIGKTRLVSELQQYAGDRLQWLEGRCISYGQAMNYGPFRGIISNYLGILPTDTEEEMKAKLQAKVKDLLPSSSQVIPIHVGSMFFPQYEAVLRTASGDDYAKQYTYPIMRNLFQKIAEKKPLVLVFEDLHWADPTSLGLLEFLMESVDEAPILYVWVYRPYRDSEAWRLRQRADKDFAYCYIEIDLHPLHSNQTDAIVSKLLRIPDIPEPIRSLVQDKASGNPLYVEEIIRSFIDKEVVVQDAKYWRATAESAEIVPSDTLQGVILSRVDRLDPEVKETLQVASVIGVGFPLSLLERVAESEALPGLLRKLEGAEMLLRRRVGNEWEYHFRHPLIHDVIYNSLLPEDRSALHEKTGSVIESMHSERLDDYTDLLAHHYGHSDDVEKALHYLILAGDKAFELASYWEALDYYGMAMEKAEGLRDERRKKQAIVDLVIKRSFARHWLGALKPDVAEKEKYLGLVEELADKDRGLSYYGYLANHYLWMFEEFGKFKKYCEKVASLGGDAIIRAEKIFGKGYERVQAWELFAKGHYESAIIVAKQILEAAMTETREFHIGYITNPCNSLWIIARAYAVMGHWSESLRACQTGLDVSAEDSASSGIIWGHGALGNTYVAMGEWDKAIAECETVLDMSPSGIGMTLSGAILLGYAYCKVGQIDKGIAFLERWKTYAKRVGWGAIFECECCLPLAEGYLMQGDISKARVNVDEALQIALERGYALHEAKAHRILGEIVVAKDFPSAEEHFSRSLEILRCIKARNEEGKTELSWGRACKQNGNLSKAKEHLTSAVEIFEELGTIRYLEWTRDFLAELA